VKLSNLRPVVVRGVRCRVPDNLRLAHVVNGLIEHFWGCWSSTGPLAGTGRGRSGKLLVKNRLHILVMVIEEGCFSLGNASAPTVTFPLFHDEI